MNRRFVYSLIFLALGHAATAQVLPDSLQQKIDGTLDKINVDSLATLQVQLPDSLLPAYHKIDSIRIGFNQKADSVRSEYRNALSKIDDRTKQINNRIDSLSHLDLSTSRYTKTVDSLNSLRQKLGQKFTSRLTQLKAKTTENLKALDLPPGYKQPIQELTGKIDGLNLNTGDIKIPQVNIPGFSVPTIPLDPLDPLDKLGDRLDKIPEVQGMQTQAAGIGNVTQQVDAYKDDIKNISQGNLKDVEKLPESIEAQASKIEGMDELKKQSGIIDADKAKLAELHDPAKAREKAVEMARKTAVDHFAGKQEQLKAAMDKIAKYKQKYSSVSSIKDLPKRPPNPMKAKPFVERLVPGLFLQYQRKNAYLADFNPYVGYRISGRFTSGLGWNHRYAYDKKTKQFVSRSVIFGPRAYTDFRLGKGFIAHIEGESMNTFVPSTLIGNPDMGEREWVWSFMTGIKKEYRIYKNLKGTALIQYNLFNRYYKAPYVDRLNSRIGFEYVIKVRKNGSE